MPGYITLMEKRRKEMRSIDAVEALGALAHEHRLTAFRLLVIAGTAGKAAGEIALDLKIAPSVLTFHLQHLRRVHLVTRRRTGRQIIYAADFNAMNALLAYLMANCCGRETAALYCNPGLTEQAGKRKNA